VITSLSLPAQRAAMAGLGQMHGAVIAIQPSTGRVVAMASTPTFNPNHVVANYAKLTRPNSGAPLLNRTTEGLYTPGSTFKTVTSTAALKSGLYTPTSPLTPAPACITVFVKLCNAGLESFPPIDLSFALTQSVNTVFAQIGQKLGSQKLRNAMSEFGFFTDPAIDLPGNEVLPSGLYRNGHQISQSAPIDVARTAIGQGNLAVTPLQMAEVAATIANGGVRMQPSLVDKAITPGGSTVYQHHPQAIQRVMSNQTAQEMTGMMQKVVDEGTGTEAQIGNLPVAGKTGTAEIGPPGSNIYTSWFIAFAPGAPGDTPKIAVAVVIDRTTEFGGQVAAPIAADVIRAYLGPNVAQ
jgi:peptidoglycan glycosyltransferase